jgi:hypothetical protein
MSSGGFRRHHGVKKKVVELGGGILVGSAAVLLLRSLLKPGRNAKNADCAATEPAAPPAEPAPTDKT